MEDLYIKDTIVAQASAPGNGAIGVIRLSGDLAPAILSQIFRSSTQVLQFESHKMYFGSLVAPQSGEPLDQVLVVWMKAPRSFTGEECVEIHCHGGVYLMSRIINELLGLGARLAEPGEFSKRAFLNGKMDLTQAEAIAEVIGAQNQLALRNALFQMEGKLSRIIANIRQRLIHFLSQLELGFDFIEEDVQLFSPEECFKELCDIEKVLGELADSFQTGQLYKDGLKVALLGRPNVGKSSLLNVLLGEDKAIIHDEAGTTRDVIQGERRIGGVHVFFFDTAGIRDTPSAIEAEGIRRSKSVLQKADVVCLMLDRSQPLTDMDEQLYRECSEKSCIIIYSKSDCPPAWQKAPFLDEDVSVLEVSSVTQKGVEELLKEVQKRMNVEMKGEGHNYVLNNVRYYRSVGVALEKINLLKDRITHGRVPEECLVEDMRAVLEELNGIVGEIDNEKVLDEIFANFCIGK